MFFQLQGNSFFIKNGRFGLFQHNGSRLQVDDFHQCCLLIHFHFHLAGSDENRTCIVLNFQLRYFLTGLAYKNFCFRLCFRIAKYATVIVLKHTKDIVSIEIKRHALMIGIQNFNSCLINFRNTDDRENLPHHCNTVLFSTHSLCCQIGSREKHCKSK